MADELRITLMKCYYNEQGVVTNKTYPRDLQEPLFTLNQGLYEAMFQENYLISYAEIVEKLEEIESILIDKYHSLHLDELNKLINKVHIFKTHFAVLDIHGKTIISIYAAVTSILKQNGKIKESVEELSEGFGAFIIRRAAIF